MNFTRRFIVSLLTLLLVACGGGGGGCGAAGALVSSLACNTSQPANRAPIANAGVNQNITTNTIVTLTGLASSDADNNRLTYRWTIVSKPAGSSAILSSATVAQPTFAADRSGSYSFNLVVNDGSIDSDVSSVIVVASEVNLAPIANAGQNQYLTYSAFPTAATVRLDGSASSDANVDPLTYAWSISSKPSASNVTLSSSTSAAPTFSPDVAGTYVFSLQVNDGKLSSNVSIVTVTASTVNSQPTAKIIAPSSASTNTVITLDGTYSFDPNGDAITYKWSIVSPSTAPALSSTTTNKPTFTPTSAGTYIVSLVVKDTSGLSSDPVTAAITVSGTNAIPVASVITPLTATLAAGSASVTLNGTGSYDPEGALISYKWLVTNKPTTNATATLSDATKVNPTLTVNTAGTYVIALIVNDGTYDSTPVNVLLTVN
jgi:hypothetical protein